MHQTAVIGVHVCLLRGDEVFLLRRYETGYEDGAYTVIAGHVEANEPATTAAVREAAEEAGITIREDDLEFVGCMHRRFSAGVAVNLFFTTQQWLGSPSNAEPSKCDDAAWFTLSNLPAQVVSYIRPALRRLGAGPWYDQHGWDEIPIARHA
jgi:8-oxo-dGTP diphosphatase